MKNGLELANERMYLVQKNRWETKWVNKGWEYYR